jgi:YHS domain-containing protein
MIRFIILAVVGYVAYRALKSWMFPAGSASRSVADSNIGEIDDVMIKDPYCGTYFPQKDAVHLSFDGRDLQFCSARCKDKFLADQSGKKDQ